ncbi:MAG: hypothetical protein ACRC0A_07085 [Chitinophagaceae bacterium]
MMKTIKLKINQELLRELLDNAMEDSACELGVRFILGDVRRSKNNLFFEQKKEVKLSLKAHEALALWHYVNLPEYTLNIHCSLLSTEIADKMMKQEMATMLELINYIKLYVEFEKIRKQQK